MKPRPIQRGLQPKSGAAAGEPPKLGNVQRIRDLNGRPLLLRRRRSGDPRRGRSRAEVSPRKRSVLFAWSVLLVVLALFVLGFLLVSWIRFRISEGVPKQTATVAVPSSVGRVERVAAPDQEEALRFVRSALKVRDPYQVGAFFRTGASTPQDVVDFLGRLEREESDSRRLLWRGNMDADAVEIEGILMTSKGPAGKLQRMLFLVPDDLGNWRLDFEGLALTCHPSWRELCEGSAVRAEVRALVGRDSYFNGPFRDESQWLCYAVESPERDPRIVPEERRRLVAYCRVGSPQAVALESILPDGAKAVRRVILELQRVEGGLDGQFEISRVMSNEWVLGKRSLDERFR